MEYCDVHVVKIDLRRTPTPPQAPPRPMTAAIRMLDALPAARLFESMFIWSIDRLARLSIIDTCHVG